MNNVQKKKISSELIRELETRSKSIRREIVVMTSRVKGSHIGGSFSVTDLLTALYFYTMRIDPEHPDDPDRDRLILSKGHCAAALYAVLAERGFASKSILLDYFANGKLLTGHPTLDCMPGVEASTGSLGHGLALGTGMAHAARYDKSDSHFFIILSDGECDAGSVWETALWAGHHHLDNLVAIVDYNKFQGFGATDDVLSLEPLKDKWNAFGWSAREINGHDFGDIIGALSDVPFERDKPSAIIAHTIKGKGVSFMENKLEWHYKYPQGEEIDNALRELE